MPLNSIVGNSSDGYIVEVDLEYPDEEHEFHYDYPVASEKFEISHNMLSDYCNSTENEYGIKLVVLIN